MPRTEVCITVDTEFSVGGIFENPERSRPVGERVVRCEADGEEQGLGFLLRTFAEHEIRATFFVEALNHCYFGDAPMAGIARRILDAGQDVQLHLHPCWLSLRGGAPARRGRPSDSCAGRSLADLREIFGAGLAAFERWGVPRPVAARTGNLQADAATYEMMAELGLPVASNLGIGLFEPADPALLLAGGRHWIHGVLELPVLSYTDVRLGARRHRKLLTVTAASWPEVETLLWTARRSGLSPVVILTHPFEYIKHRDVDYTQVTRNRINQQRLVRLCRFLRDHADEFASVSFRDGKDGWLRAGAVPSPDFTVPAHQAIGRVVVNRLNDWVWGL